ncbi:hypothetical protein [Rickettsia sp.]|uniref:hypothetical protein n=1 Tax=Rickettsia sp. TaxID=789 RepID=UPI00397C7F87
MYTVSPRGLTTVSSKKLTILIFSIINWTPWSSHGVTTEKSTHATASSTLHSQFFKLNEYITKLYLISYI